MQNLKIALLLVFFLNLCHQAHASTGIITAGNDSIRKPFYEAWIYSNTGSKRIIGYIYQTTDSSLIVVKTPESVEKQDIPVAQIKKIAFRRFNNPGALILKTAGAGLVFGGIFGYAQGDDDPNSFFQIKARTKAIFYGVAFFVLGLFIGSGLTLLRRIKIISGNLQNYKRERASIQGFTLTRK